MKNIDITISNNHSAYAVDNSIIKNIIKFVISQERYEVNSISIIITSDEKLNVLKKRYFNQDLLTDTISFNLNEPDQPVEGEIYLSLDRIFDNARKYNITPEEEFARVIIHSILHTLGYEDNIAEEKREMFKRQDNYLNDVNWQGILKKD